MKPELEITSPVWKELGNHGARLTILEGNHVQHNQDIINVRAELHGVVADHKLETNNYIHRIEAKMDATEAKMEAIWDAIAIKLNTLQKFQWTILVGGAVVASMVMGLVIIAWQVLTNHDKLSWMWSSHG